MGHVPEGVQQAVLLFQHTAEEEATPSQPAIKEEEQVVEVSDSKDDFEVFNQPQSPKAPTGDFNHLPLAQVSNLQGTSSVPNAMVL